MHGETSKFHTYFITYLAATLISDTTCT